MVKPAFANVNNVPQVIFAGGDGVIYSFVPETGRLLWKCDCLPMRERKEKLDFDNFFIGTPVVVGDKLFIGQGMPSDVGPAPKNTYVLCLDIMKKGDVSLNSYDPKSGANKDSALVWAFGGPVFPVPKKGRKANFGSTDSTAAVKMDSVIPEKYGDIHRLDVNGGRSGARFQGRGLRLSYRVDGRVFVGTDDGEIVIFAHGRTAKVLATIDFDEFIGTTPVAANGVLYVMTRSMLYAISQDK